MVARVVAATGVRVARLRGRATGSASARVRGARPVGRPQGVPPRPVVGNHGSMQSAVGKPERLGV